MKSATVAAIKKRRGSRVSFAVVTDLASGSSEIVEADDEKKDLPGEVAKGMEMALVTDDARVVEAGDRRYFVEPFNPTARIVIIGAVHITQALVQFAELAGYEPHVVDPRDSWTTIERFPDVRMHRTWPEEAFAEIGIDRRTAVVTLTHDPKIDDPALVMALRSPACYVGALGSKRTHAKRVARLKDEGFGEDQISRINAPVGLDIGAATAAEIALSIMAQVVGSFRGAKPA